MAENNSLWEIRGIHESALLRFRKGRFCEEILGAPLSMYHYTHTHIYVPRATWVTNLYPIMP